MSEASCFLDLGGSDREGRRRAAQAERGVGDGQTRSGRWARRLLVGGAHLKSLGADVKLGMGGHGTGRIAGGWGGVCSWGVIGLESQVI